MEKKYGNVIGKGNTATIYEWDIDKVLKLFYEGYPRMAVELEFHNAKAIENMDFSKPKAYEIITYDGRDGIVYDKVEGVSLLDYVLNTADVNTCANLMANLHHNILQNKTNQVMDYKLRLKMLFYNNSQENIELSKVLKMIDDLPDGDTLCHGDFHPGNILMSDKDASIIDFMNVCHGHYLYDVARSVFLVQYTPVPEGTNDKEGLLQLKKDLADLYLIKMNVTRDMIEGYLAVIMKIRKIECPDE